MIAVVDLGISNLGSVLGALRRIDRTTHVVDDPADLPSASVVLLPGVGAFGDGMAALSQQSLVEPLRAAAASGTGILGLCLGMQLLATSGTEHGDHAGLGLIPGTVVRLPADADHRVPNLGWCDVFSNGTDVVPSRLDQESFYFVHSFHLCCDDDADVAATIDFAGERITAAVRRGPVVGMQFHPEKSQDAGLDLLDHVLTLLGSRGRVAR